MAKKLAVQSLINVAGMGFSIGTTALSIQWILKSYQYDPTDTLVLFNITDPGRLGVLCPWQHSQKSQHTPWSPDLIPWQVLDQAGSKKIYREMQIEQVESRSAFELRALMDYLELRGYPYRFTMMMDYTNHPLLKPIIQQHKQHLIELDLGPSMFDYAMNTHLLDADGVHPSTTAHERIAVQILDQLEIT